MPPDFFRRLLTPFTKPDRRYCPICREWSEFQPFGLIQRPHAMCPVCKSLERQRLLWLYLEQKTDFFLSPMAVLDIAPHLSMMERFYAQKNLRYLSINLRYSETAMKKMDLTNLAISDNIFDCILCSHVLEHIPDDGKAMREMHRVLKPGGWSVIQVPVRYSLEKTYEDPSIVSPEDRLTHFGQQDHVRVYGKDFVSRLTDAGFKVESSSFALELGPVMIRRCGLKHDHLLYICRKPKA